MTVKPAYLETDELHAIQLIEKLLTDKHGKKIAIVAYEIEERKDA